MNPVGALIIYILLWWVTLFAILPMVVSGRWESPDDGVNGADPGAPAKPDMKRKLITTSWVSFLLWLFTLAVILSGIFNFNS